MDYAAKYTEHFLGVMLTEDVQQHHILVALYLNWKELYCIVAMCKSGMRRYAILRTENLRREDRSTKFSSLLRDFLPFWDLPSSQECQNIFFNKSCLPDS